MDRYNKIREKRILGIIINPQDEKWLEKRKERRKIVRGKKDGEKDASRTERGKEIMRKINSKEEREMDFRIQSRVDVIDIANLAIGLKKLRESGALKNLNTLTQSAFKLAIRALMDEEEEIKSTDEAMDVLEDMRFIDANSSSLSGGALQRNRIKESIREVKRDSMDYSQSRNRNQPTMEEIEDNLAKAQRERERMEREGIEPTLTPAQKKIKEEAERYMREMMQPPTNSSLYPNAERSKGEPDVTFNP